MSDAKMIVVESPLSGDTVRNRRFAAWCCRAVWEVDRVVAIASHLICPQYLDDREIQERGAGWNLDICWYGDAHVFFEDMGVSDGMLKASRTCEAEGIKAIPAMLSLYHPPSWEAFQRGEWPPCTPGFGPSEIELAFEKLGKHERARLAQFAHELFQEQTARGLGE